MRCVEKEDVARASWADETPRLFTRRCTSIGRLGKQERNKLPDPCTAGRFRASLGVG